MLKPRSLEVSVAVLHTGRGAETVWDVCEAGGGDMVVEIAAHDEAGRPIACLMAAAPDLYHALQGMVNFYATMAPDARKHLVPAERKILAAAEKALKRAEGV